MVSRFRVLPPWKIQERVNVSRHGLDSTQLLTTGWIELWFMYLVVEPDVGALIPYCDSHKSQPVSPWASCTLPGCSPEKGNDKPLLSILYPENPEKGNRKAETLNRLDGT